MDIAKTINDIWKEETIKEVRPEILERKWCFCCDVLKSNTKILLIGFNPSYRDCIKEMRPVKPFSFEAIMNSCRNHYVLPEKKWDPYWTPISDMLCNDEVDLRNITSYWDIFSFRERDQRKFKKSKNPSNFVIEHIRLAQRIMEIVKPELIVVKNKEAWAYFGYYFGLDGKLKNVRWMNYRYENLEKITCGSVQYELRKIIGLHDGYDLHAIEGHESSLVNTKVLFMPHINQYMKKENRPTPQCLKGILDKF